MTTQDKIREVLEYYISSCCMICTDPSIKIPQQPATDQALSAITKIIEEEKNK